MKKILIISLIVFIPNLVQAAFPSPFADYGYCQEWTMDAGLNGYTSQGANTYSIVSGSNQNPAGLKFTLISSAIIKSASGYAKYTTNAKSLSFGIYSDSAGERGSLLGATAASDMTNTSYVVETRGFNAPLILAAGDYWLEMSIASEGPGTGNGDIAYDTGGASNSSYTLDDLSVPTYGTSQFSMWVNFGGVATTSTSGVFLWATTTDTVFKTDTFGGHISTYNQASSTPNDFIFGSGTDCNTDAGSAINPVWDSYSSTTGEVVVGLVATDVSSTSAKNVLVYYGKASDTDHVGNATDNYLSGFWPLGTSTTYLANSVTFDKSSNTNTGSMIGNTRGGAIGVIGSAFRFDGSGDYVISNTAPITAYPITLSAWIQSNLDGPDGITQGALGIGRTSQSGQGFIFIGKATSNRAFIGSRPDIGAQKTASSTNTIGTGWNLVTGIADGATVDLYLNGVFQDSIGQTKAFPAVDELGIGARMDSAPDNFFEGRIDDPRMYNTKLHPMDILTMYNNTVDSDRFWDFGAEETPTAPVAAAVPRLILYTQMFINGLMTIQ